MKRLPGGDGRRGLSGAARREPGALFRLRSAHALFRRHQPPAPCGAVDAFSLNDTFGIAPLTNPNNPKPIENHRKMLPKAVAM